MAENKYVGGIQINTSGFEVKAAAPVDSRFRVKNAEGLNELLTYEGLVSYNEGDKKYYKFTNGEWHVLSINTPEELAEVIKGLIATETTGAMEFKGATASLPENPSKGDMYKVSSQFAVGEETAKVGDTIVYNGEQWFLIPSGDDIEDTWRKVIAGGNELANDEALEFVAGENVTITEEGGRVTISSSYKDTHYESKLVVGNEATDASDETVVENNNVHLNLIENGEVKSSHKIVGAGGISVTHATGEDGNVITIEAAEGAKYDLTAKTENSEAIISLAGTDNTEDKVAIIGSDAVEVTIDSGKIKVAAHDTVTTVKAGVENGTITVETDGTEETIAIPGLDSMAYEKKEDYATSAENGAKAMAEQNERDIQAINNVDTGILKQAKDYADGKFATQSGVNVLVEEIYGSTTTTGESRLDNLDGLVEELEGKVDALEVDVDYLLGNPTEGLEYTLSDDGNYYICTGVGTAKGDNIVIASEHEGLPVTGIGDSAFSGEDRFNRVIIPDGVTSIGNTAFRDCTSLTSMVIPGSVASIGSGSFSDCTSLTSVEIGDGVTSIGYRAFYNCTSLTSITVPGSVTNIGGYAFSNCSLLTEIVISDSVTSMGTNVFENCTSLQKIYYTGSEEDWSRIQFEEEWSEELLSKVVYNFANDFVAVNEVISEIQNSLDDVTGRVDVLESDDTVEGSVAKTVRDSIEVLYASLVNGMDSEGNDVVVGYADEANSATKATQDANSNVIHETYQTKTDDTLATTDKTVVGAINEINEKRLDKISTLETWYGGVDSIEVTTDGISWTDTFRFLDEAGQNMVEGKMDTFVPILAGDNVTFTAQGEVVKINAVLPEETDYTVSIEEDTTDSTIAKRYIFKQLGEEIGRIDLAKELVVQSGSVGEVTEADKPYTGAKVGDKYIQLVIANQDAPIYIPAKDLVDIYTAKADATEVQVAISNTNEISATLVNNGITTEKIANDAITEDKIADAVNEKIAKGVTAEGWGNHANAGYAKTENLGDLAGKDKIADDDIADNAAIAVGKINGLGKLATKDAIVEGDIDGTIGIGKISGLGALAAKDTIADADIAEGAAIAHTKIAGLGTLATKDTIANADIAANAAIAKTKLASDVQASLGKADNALQQVEVGTGLTVTTKAENKQTINIDESIVFILDCNY